MFYVYKSLLFVQCLSSNLIHVCILCVVAGMWSKTQKISTGGEYVFGWVGILQNNTREFCVEFYKVLWKVGHVTNNNRLYCETDLFWDKIFKRRDLGEFAYSWLGFVVSKLFFFSSWLFIPEFDEKGTFKIILCTFSIRNGDFNVNNCLQEVS